MQHRATILRALYTLLKWNPYLQAKERHQPKTRFKRWWTLCGAPVEAVAGVDFNEILRAHESNNPEVTALAMLLHGLKGTFGEKFFGSEDVLATTHGRTMSGDNEGWPRSPQTLLEEASGKRFLGDVNARQIGHKLGVLWGRPVEFEGRVLRLERDENAKRGHRYRVDVKE